MTEDTLILVPGLACTEALFAPQRATLDARRRVMVADHARDETIAGIAERLLAAAPERFDLAGLSMGGYVALEVMRQAPGRVARLALLDTSARADAPEAAQTRRDLIATAEAGGLLEEVFPALWERLVAPARQDDAVLRAAVRGMMEAVGPEAFARQQRAIMSRIDHRPHLPLIEVPTVVIVGAEDLITPPERAREMAEAIEWASLVVVPECGHLSTLERPDEVTRILVDWLDRAPA